MIASISSSEFAVGLLELRSLDAGLVGQCLARRCSWLVPPHGLLMDLGVLKVL
jgi:hypothetical protein